MVFVARCLTSTISPPSATPSSPLIITLSLLHYDRASIRRGKSDGYVEGGWRGKRGGGEEGGDEGDKSHEVVIKKRKTRHKKAEERALKREICLQALH